MEESLLVDATTKHTRNPDVINQKSFHFSIIISHPSSLIHSASKTTHFAVVLANPIHCMDIVPVIPILVEACLDSTTLILSSDFMRILLRRSIGDLTDHALRAGSTSAIIIIEVAFANLNVIGNLFDAAPGNN